MQGVGSDMKNIFHHFLQNACFLQTPALFNVLLYCFFMAMHQHAKTSGHGGHCSDSTGPLFMSFAAVASRGGGGAVKNAGGHLSRMRRRGVYLFLILYFGKKGREQVVKYEFAFHFLFSRVLQKSLARKRIKYIFPRIISSGMFSFFLQMNFEDFLSL